MLMVIRDELVAVDSKLLLKAALCTTESTESVLCQPAYTLLIFLHVRFSFTSMLSVAGSKSRYVFAIAGY